MTRAALVPIFADQLSHNLASLKASDRETDIVLMMEVSAEADHVPHHRKKMAFLFSAMRHFADELRQQGWRVDYVKLDADRNAGSFDQEITAAVQRHDCQYIRCTEPGEWRVLQLLKALQNTLPVSLEICPDDRFVCDHATFRDWAKERKSLRMEYFYRDRRRQTGLLMDGDNPVGGQWNFDANNRKRAPKGWRPPAVFQTKPDAITQDVLAMVSQRFPDRFGDLDNFFYCVTASQAEAALDHFIQHALPSFGDFQDAMVQDEPFLSHSVISLYLNAGLLDPVEVCRKAEAAWHRQQAPLNAVEGFIRQIIGWREYVRGIYWMHMPGYLEQNFFGHKRELPSFYWTGDTDMNCVAQSVGQTINHAYAHHIQRLMVTGNFAMLAGIDPKHIHEWYLAVYVDAFEWVEAPNTLGMSQFADGGLLGSKPYAAGGNYINKMSNYCAPCRYKVSEKSGPDACPFNYLYWDFVVRNRQALGNNPRMAQMYQTWDRMADQKKDASRQSAARFLKDMEAGNRV
ncbi:MAG TPA: cryptochrome/photolyase family protein [Rhodospirillaceae bacterium]|nr:cryptochrome/photolyase family protein [Rhodospirillaceae bacterium]MBB57478.1 cryptochrome/photolyase family protein [Rhodospirillaceae bacterium]HBM13463.1 cryptochrome/photolyase family protein [Rhodospirillaceae bacterium]|tara:strand:+ start:33702 stop:35246 length:1545 start_codon:yes stop_codon:yes gene_type:complete